MTCPAHGLAASRRFLDWEDVDLIRSLVAKLPRRKVLVVDLGVGSGTTALAVFAQRTRGIRVVSIDHSEDAINWAAQAVANIEACNLWESRQFDSVVAAKDFENVSIDLLLLDTAHTLAQTRQELAAWLPKLKSGSFLWAHDYRNENGVRRAVDESVMAGALIRSSVRGLGWAGRKA